VADRFHLLQNLRQTIEQQLSRVQTVVARSLPHDAGRDIAKPPVVTPRRPVDAELAQHGQLARDGRRALWRDMFDQVKAARSDAKQPVIPIEASR
jgi:hypothetical protein